MLLVTRASLLVARTLLVARALLLVARTLLDWRPLLLGEIPIAFETATLQAETWADQNLPAADASNTYRI